MSNWQANCTNKGKDISAHISTYLPHISNQVYQELSKDANQLDRSFTKEELNYYTTGLLWLRLLDIKKKSNRQNLTAAEKDIIRTTEDDVYVIPAPIYAYLHSIGNVKDAMGKLTYLNVPDLPIAAAQGLGGYHNVTIDVGTHTLYEEVPCLGVAGDMVMILNSATAEPPRNFRITTPADTKPSINLLGNQAVIGKRRDEILRKLSGYGITENDFPDDGNETRFNRPYLMAMSDALRKCETFRNEEGNFPKMTSNGNMTMAITTTPQTLDIKPTQMWTDVIASNTTPEESSAAIMEAATVFGFQLHTGTRPLGTAYEANKNWLCVERSGNNNWQPGNDWVQTTADGADRPPAVPDQRNHIDDVVSVSGGQRVKNYIHKVPFRAKPFGSC